MATAMIAKATRTSMRVKPRSLRNASMLVSAVETGPQNNTRPLANVQKNSALMIVVR
jgi:hypothetical protein